MKSLHLVAASAVALPVLAGIVYALPLRSKSAAAETSTDTFVCSGTFSSGSGMAGSSIEKDGKAVCFFAADSGAEAAVQNVCGQNSECEVTALTSVEGDSRIVETTLAVRHLSGPLPVGPARQKNDDQLPIGPVQCPSLDFETFARHFSSEISLQAKFTHWPLQSTTIDAAAQPEPRPVTKEVTEQEMAYPVMMDIARAKREGKVVTVEEDGEATAHVDYAGSDSGEQIRYLFKRDDACWRLVAIDDRSL